MKKLIFAFLFISLVSSAQTVNYTVTNDLFPNPERGFYKHTETKSGYYSLLDEQTLRSYRSNNVTLILRVFYLEKFRTSAISSTYLSNIGKDLSAIRNAGLKVIVRFAYSDDEAAGQRNATKSRILNHITQLAPVLNANADVIAGFQAGFIGTWGEWYYTDYFGVSKLTAANYADRKEVFETMLSKFPKKGIALRTPAIKQKMYGSDPITQTEAFTLTSKANAAHHNDCFLSASDDWGTYVNISTEYPYLAAETKFLSMGGETCNPSTYSECTNALEKLNLFNYDYLNMDYNETVLANFETEKCMDEIKRRLGYRFELRSSTLSQTMLNITLQNTGFGHAISSRPVFIVYRNTVTGKEIPVAVNTEARLWFKGSPITIAQVIPADLPAGSYKLFLSMPDKALTSRPEYSIRFANVGTWEPATGYNDLKLTLNK